MKARYLIGCIVFAALSVIVFFLSRQQESKTNSLGMQTVEKQERLPVVNVYSTNGPLASAYEMTAFIDKIRDTVPVEDTGIRLHLNAFEVAFFLNDYVMAAKTNKSLALTKSEIIHAFTNVSQDTSGIEVRLRTYAGRPGTLSDHYKSISEIPAEKKNIEAIQAAMTENSVPIDMESDLLMDCIRYAVENTDIYEMFGPNPRRIAEATPYPPALNALVSMSDTLFRHRFEKRFGLGPDVVTNLMNQLKQLRLYNVSEADVQIPAHIK